MEAIEFLEKTKRICDYFFAKDERCNNCPIMPFCMNAPDTIKDMEAYIEITEKCELKKTQEEFLEEFRNEIDIDTIISWYADSNECSFNGIKCPVSHNKKDSCNFCRKELRKYFGI